MEDFDEDHWLEFNNETRIDSIARGADEGSGEFVFDTRINNPINLKGLLQNWWNTWEQWSDNYLDKNFAGFLVKNGINPKREVIEGIGLNTDYVRDHATNQSRPEDWESEYDESLSKYEKFNPSADDRLASPMHQPFENRLKAAFGLI